MKRGYRILTPLILFFLLSHCHKMLLGPSGAEGEEPGKKSIQPYNIAIDGKIGTVYYKNYPALAFIYWQTDNTEDVQFYEVDLDGNDSADLTNNLSFIATASLNNANSYFVKVRAVSKNGTKTAWSTPLTLHIDNTPPSNITTFTVSPLGGGLIQVEWTPSDDSGSGLKSYNLAIQNIPLNILSLVAFQTDSAGNLISNYNNLAAIDPINAAANDNLFNEVPGWINFISADKISGTFKIQLKLKNLGIHNFSIKSEDKAVPTGNQSLEMQVLNLDVN